MKSQSVRLVDVFVLGPFMLWAGSQTRGLPEWARAALLVGGLATVLYNAQNYLEVERGGGECR